MNKRPKVAITGSTGLVGSRIIELLAADFEFIPLVYPRFDITNRESVNDVIRETDFDIFLHLAAYTNVDLAEIEKKKAFKVNVTGTKNTFEATVDKGKKYIYFSTGFVFDGKKGPYFEDSKINPLGYYGKTKYEGEKVVKNRGMIVRIEYPYRASYANRRDFVRTIKGILEEGKKVEAVQDSIITPTFIDDVAYALKHLINNHANEVFHIVGADALSPYEAVQLIAKTFKLDANLIKKTSYEKFFEGRAPRPQWAHIKTKKNKFHKMKTFEEALRFIYNSSL
jgi:dTDP-4-dehydrorhamnose reductase